MTPLCYLMGHPQSPRSVTSARLANGTTFGLMKLNASKTKAMIVFRSHTMHPQSAPLTTGGTVLESDALDIYGVTFSCKITFEKHLRSGSRPASQRLSILRKSWRVFQDRSLLWR